MMLVMKIILLLQSTNYYSFSSCFIVYFPRSIKNYVQCGYAPLAYAQHASQDLHERSSSQQYYHKTTQMNSLTIISSHQILCHKMIIDRGSSGPQKKLLSVLKCLLVHFFFRERKQWNLLASYDLFAFTHKSIMLHLLLRSLKFTSRLPPLF